MNKIGILVASLLLVCLGTFLVGGGMSRQDYYFLGLIGVLIANNF